MAPCKNCPHSASLHFASRKKGKCIVHKCKCVGYFTDRPPYINPLLRKIK